MHLIFQNIEFLFNLNEDLI